MRLALVLLLVSSSALAQGYAPRAARETRVVDATVDVDPIAADSCVDATVTVAGVKSGDAVQVARNFSALEPYWTTDARVSNASTDEVTFRACTSTPAGVDPPSGEYRFTVVRQ